MRQRKPDDEVQHCASQEKPHIQILKLLARQVHGLRPAVNPVPAEEQGNEQQCHQRQSSASRFQQPPDDHSPASTGKMVQHGDGQTAQGHSRPEQKGQQVGVEELRGAAERSQNAHTQHCNPDPERTPLQPVHLRPGHVGGGLDHRGPPAPNRARSSAGNSARGACWLNCKARM